MQIRLAVIGYDGTEAFRVETDTTEDLPIAVIVAADAFGKQWNDHFDGVSRSAAIMAAFAIGVAGAGKNEEPISYRGRDIIAGVRP